MSKKGGSVDDVKKAHVDELFNEAMDVRMSNPKKAQKLFEEIINEARLKLSWVLLKVNNFKYDYDSLLMPVAKADDASLDQKQRAFTNLSCAIAFNPKDTRYSKALEYAQAGIDLDGVGTNRLWENLGNAQRRMGKLDEAQKSFEKAAELNPESANALARAKSINRFLDPTKAAAAVTNPVDRLLQTRDFSKDAVKDKDEKEESSERRSSDAGLEGVDEEEEEQMPNWIAAEAPTVTQIGEIFLFNERPLPKDRPVLSVDSKAFVTEPGTTLEELRAAYGPSHVVEYGSEINYYRDAFVLENGKAYALILDRQEFDIQDAALLFGRMEKHLNRMAKSMTRSHQNALLSKLVKPKEEEEESTTPSVAPSSPGAPRGGTLRSVKEPSKDASKRPSAQGAFDGDSSATPVAATVPAHPNSGSPSIPSKFTPTPAPTPAKEEKASNRPPSGSPSIPSKLTPTSTTPTKEEKSPSSTTSS